MKEENKGAVSANRADRDTGYAPNSWEFDAQVTKVFDDMLRRSIPQYDVMRKTCFDVACKFVQPGTSIVDLGCSRGEALAPLVDHFGESNRYIGVEVSPPMLEASKDRFKEYIRRGIVEINDLDLRKDYPQVSASVTMAVFMVQFTPIEYRAHILKRIYEHTEGKGVFIFVEKVLGSSATMDELLVDQYHALKFENGYNDDEIRRKKLSLEGKLVPVTAAWNEELLRSSGFEEIECFWRWMNFAGWIAFKH
ncbi:MAG: methyltransferase [Pseudomonadota bacterium]